MLSHNLSLTRTRRVVAGCVLALGLSGCSVSQGLGTAQKGLAVVDVATDRATDEYQRAVQAIRQWCISATDVDACERRFHVDDDSVAKVLAGMESLSSAYAKMAIALQEAGAAWNVVAPQMKATVEAAKELGQ